MTEFLFKMPLNLSQPTDLDLFLS